MIWNVATGKLVRRMEDGYGDAAACSPDGNTYALGLDLIDLRNGKPLHQFAGHEYDVESIGFLPNGRLASVGSVEFWIWDGVTGKLLSKFGDSVGPFAISADGKRLAAGHGTGLTVYDDAGKEQSRFKDGKTKGVRQIQFSPNGMILALALDKPSGEKSGRVTLVDVASGKKLRDLFGHEDDVVSVTFHPSGKRVISGGSDNTIRFWDVDTSKEVMKLTGHGRRIETLAVSPDGKWLCSGSCDDTIRLWDIAAGKEVWQVAEVEPSCLAFSPDSSTLAWARSSNDPTIHLVDIASRKEAKSLRGHRGQVRCLAFSADGKLLASGSEDATILVWSLSKDQ